MKNIIIITPIKHLDNVYNILDKYTKVYYKPYIKSEELNNFLRKNNHIEYLFTNPNKQGYILGKQNLENTNIKVINTASTGTNHIDKKYCKENNIIMWSLTTDYELINDLPSTSELAFGLVLSLLRKIHQSFNSVKKYEWNYEPYIGRQVKGLSLGIIGFGRLGKIMANYGYSFGMKVYIYDPYLDNIDNKYNKVDLNELLNKSDVVSLHVHVTDETRQMVNKNFLNKDETKFLFD